MERQFLKGCEAIAESAVRAGCRFYAGYPITPQNEIPEYFARRMPEVGGVYLQGESEVASVNMVYGAAGGGTRCMTSSASCGISLKAEGMSYMAMARVPAVVLNAQRGGPGVGDIRPAQQDYFQATKALGNGGFQYIVLAPSTIQEAADMTYEAFDLADKYRNPVMVLTDGFTAAMMEPVVLPEQKSEEELAAIKAAKKADWALKGKVEGQPLHKISFNAGSKPPQGKFMNTGEDRNKTDAAMYELWKEEEVRYEEYRLDNAEVVIAAYGVAARISATAINILRAEGYKVGMIRPIRVNPFPEKPYAALDPAKVKGILVVEHSIPSQMIYDVKLATGNTIQIDTCLRSCGEIISRDQIVEDVKKIFAK
ncbi:MAG: 3-methyl-2-oxobutanoate dehydrogenase subunit VorB [Erysipelotrichaceae bacterium]|nr:3-methyl-2-oxobutanoate dehydrogenase subunit VorB [Erysipelotrichaceae bacterium]